jgi:glycosyltransferase involved in cell wall biosynthesis
MDISVAMAVHNGQAYLEQQLDSILNQTLTPCEIVVSDDGSSDNTLAIVEKFARKEKIVKLVRCTAQGVNANFANAITACKGAFIATSDQDDIWHREKLAHLAAAWGSSTLLAYGRSELIDENNQQLDNKINPHFSLNNFRQGHQPFFFIFSNCVSGHSMLVAKQLVRCALPFPADCMYDHWLALVASVKSQIVFVPQAITLHRIHCCNTINNTAKNRTEKREGGKTSKFARFFAHRQVILARLEKGILESEGLSKEETEYLHKLKNSMAKLETVFFDKQLFFRLFRHRHQLFHGNFLKECRNKALGGNYFKLLDIILNRERHC